MWIHTCFISQHCSIWREVTSLSLDCLTFELFLFPWSSNRLQFLRSVVESMHNTQHVNNMHRLFDSSWSRSSVLETSLTCFDFLIRRNPVPIPCFPLTFSFPLRTQLYIPVQVLLLRVQQGVIEKKGYCYGLF